MIRLRSLGPFAGLLVLVAGGLAGCAPDGASGTGPSAVQVAQGRTPAGPDTKQVVLQVTEGMT